MRKTRRTLTTAAALVALGAGSALLAPRFVRAQAAPQRAPAPQGAQQQRQPQPARPAQGAQQGAAPAAAAGRNAAAPVVGAPVQAPALPVERYTLPNGLEVILHEDHRTPTVAVNIWYHVGGKDEAPGRNGFAHLFEHLMFQGSRHVAEDTFFLNLERVGASGINGTTGDDRTNYFETVPAGRLNLALWLESDRMAYLLEHVNQTTFESQRRIVLNERRQSYENAPYGNVPFYLREAIFPDAHPYHRLPIGTAEDLNRATIQDVWQFFQTWYVPNNATLVIAGDIQPAQTRQLVEQYFGPIPRGPDVPRRQTPPPAALDREVRIHAEAGVELPRVYIAWPTPAFYAPGDAELDLTAAVLTVGRSSRLYRRLVHEMQIAQDVSAYQASAQLGSTFDIVATARPGHGADELLRVIDEELERLRREPPSEPELARARTGIVTHMVFATERVAERADMFNRYNHYNADPNYFARDLARYQTPTVADIQNTVRTHLPADRRVVVFVHPTEGAPVSGRLREGPPPQGGQQQRGGAQGGQPQGGVQQAQPQQQQQGGAR